MKKNRVITKEELIEIGKKVFSEKGYFLSKVSDIVREAGVCQGTYYLHFESKKELLGAIIQEFSRDIRKILFEDNSKGKSPPYVLIEKELHLFDYFMNNQNTTLLIFREGYGEHEFVTKLTKIHQDMTDARKECLLKILKDEIKSELYGYVLGGILRGFFMYSIEKKLNKEEYTALLTNILERFLNSLNFL